MIRDHALGAQVLEDARALDTRWLNLESPETESEFTVTGSEQLPVLHEA